jgi:hypothetical protein
MYSAAGEEPDLVDHRRDLLARGQPERLAGVAALQRHQLVGVRLDRVGEAEQRQGALRRGGVAPAGEGARRGGVGAVDVLGRRHRRRGEHLAGRRVHQVGPAAVGGVDVLPADEVAQLELVAHRRSLSFDCADPVVIVHCGHR